MNKSARNRLIFKIVFFAFLAAMLVFAWDFMRRTSPPWDKAGEQVQKYKVD